VVRSPTFNLMQTFDTEPPVLHVDLYRVASHAGLGIEDYLETHVCLIEWADRVRDRLPAGTVEIHLRIKNEKTRTLSVKKIPGH